MILKATLHLTSNLAIFVICTGLAIKDETSETTVKHLFCLYLIFMIPWQVQTCFVFCQKTLFKTEDLIQPWSHHMSFKL